MTRLARLAYLSAFLAAPVHAQAPATSDQGPPTIVAHGTATVKRAPDQAFVTFATESRAPEPAAAQAANARAMTAVRDRLRDADIPDEAVRTVSFMLREEADYVEGRRVPRGYLVTNAIEVRVDEIDELGELIDGVVSAGATSVQGVRFDLQARDEAEREAVRLAVEDARRRAEAAAAGAGLRLTGIRRVEEHGPRGSPPPPEPLLRTMAAEAQAASTPVAAGEIAIEASVTLTASASDR